MSKSVEIRWHGRGGQGAKTAALLLADVAFQTGKYVQGFPEYGPERMGAPITAYNRISDTPIRVHSNIYDPQFVVVVDESLLETVDVTKGLKKDGAILVNTQRTKEEIIPHLKGYEGEVYKIDARKISIEALGKYFPNTPMLAAIVKVSGIMTDEDFLKDIQDQLTEAYQKIGIKPNDGIVTKLQAPILALIIANPIVSMGLIGITLADCVTALCGLKFSIFNK